MSFDERCCRSFMSLDQGIITQSRARSTCLHLRSAATNLSSTSHVASVAWCAASPPLGREAVAFRGSS